MSPSPVAYPSFVPKLVRKEMKEKSDHDALMQDRAHYPCPTHNAKGVLRLEASEAEEMLKLDVSNQLHEWMMPKELYHSQAVYQQNALKKFCGHIYQEV